MRLIVLSDTHGRIGNFERLWERQRGADLFIHLGDGAEETARMRAAHPETAFAAVRGNCDVGSGEPFETLMEFDGQRIFFTHGHKYGVKGGIGKLLAAGAGRRAGAVLFGHTHTPFLEYIDGVCVMNPGSLELPRTGRTGFGVVELLPDGVRAFLSDL